jgi:DNA-binding response OmpR family regulator
VPVLLLTAKDGEYDEADGLDYGADDYLTKPFSFVVLVARLRALLRRDPAPRPTVLHAAGVTLDPAAHRVAVDGSDVPLAPREFLLLEHLIRAHPAAVRKEDLLDKVWGDLDDANVVEVYVGYLRRKLGRSRIETVRGVGYRMAP